HSLLPHFPTRLSSDLRFESDSGSGCESRWLTAPVGQRSAARRLVSRDDAEPSAREIPKQRAVITARESGRSTQHTRRLVQRRHADRKSTRLNSSHQII